MILNKYFNLAGLLILSFILLSACSTEPKPIEYNQDQCAECKMMISDSRFGAELVTKKGKIYKYDAAECMVRAFHKNRETDYAHVLVTDFHSPGNLINARSATFLIDKKRPSPMGAYLSAYEMKNEIEKDLLSKDSKVMTWENILKNL